MARFIVRVELLGADSDDYNALHEKMAAYGYSREIQDTDGATFNLPTAEYTAYKDGDADKVRDEIKSIAGSVISNYYVLVSELDNISWFLKKS